MILRQHEHGSHSIAALSAVRSTINGIAAGMKTTG
jgi:hypothetical protein